MSTRETGAKGEEFAADTLKKRGLKILCRNYYTRYGEIDIIAEDKDCIAFVEVRCRKAGAIVDPAQSVTPSKQQKIIKSAVQYLLEHPSALQPRFDVFEIETERSGPFRVRSFRYIIQAYEVNDYESI